MPKFLIPAYAEMAKVEATMFYFNLLYLRLGAEHSTTRLFSIGSIPDFLIRRFQFSGCAKGRLKTAKQIQKNTLFMLGKSFQTTFSGCFIADYFNNQP